MTLALSVAFAVTVTVPLTVDWLDGAVMETEGGVVSGTTVTVAVPVTPPTSAVIVASAPGITCRKHPRTGNKAAAFDRPTQRSRIQTQHLCVQFGIVDDDIRVKLWKIAESAKSSVIDPGPNLRAARKGLGDARLCDRVK